MVRRGAHVRRVGTRRRTDSLRRVLHTLSPLPFHARAALHRQCVASAAIVTRASSENGTCSNPRTPQHRPARSSVHRRLEVRLVAGPQQPIRLHAWRGPGYQGLGRRPHGHVRALTSARPLHAIVARCHGDVSQHTCAAHPTHLKSCPPHRDRRCVGEKRKLIIPSGKGYGALRWCGSWLRGVYAARRARTAAHTLLQTPSALCRRWRQPPQDPRCVERSTVSTRDKSQRRDRARKRRAPSRLARPFLCPASPVPQGARRWSSRLSFSRSSEGASTLVHVYAYRPSISLDVTAGRLGDFSALRCDAAVETGRVFACCARPTR